jgi:hypothetical protein
MPHVPRRFSPTTGVPQEFTSPPAQAHAPIPVPVKPDTPESRRKSIGIPKINLNTYQPDQKQLLKTMFGHEPDVDPYTGRLVLKSKPPASPFTATTSGDGRK